MLTEKDREWLEEREKLPSLSEEGGYFCKHCCHAVFEDGEFCCDEPEEGREEENLLYCPTSLVEPGDWAFGVFAQKIALHDAAEFEARVAARMTGLKAEELPCYPNFLCPYRAKHIGSCKACYLKHARLAVEAEMEKEEK